MQVSITREFKGEPAFLVFVEGGDPRIFFEERLRGAIRSFHPEGHGVPFKDAPRAWKQAEHLFAAIERGETKKGFQDDLRPVAQFCSERHRPSLQLLGK